MKLNYIPAETTNIETLVVFLRDFYEHEALRFDETAARRALQQIIANPFLARLYPFTLRNTQRQSSARITSAGFLLRQTPIVTFENDNYSTNNVLPKAAHR